MRKPSKRQQRAMLETIAAPLEQAAQSAAVAEDYLGDGVLDAIRLMIDLPRTFVAQQIAARK